MSESKKCQDCNGRGDIGLGLMVELSQCTCLTCDGTGRITEWADRQETSDEH